MLIWINIAIVGLIAIIAVKLYFNRRIEKKDGNEELAESNIEIKDKVSGLTSKIAGSASSLSNSKSDSNVLGSSSSKPASLRKEGTTPDDYSVYIVPEVHENNNINAATIEYESPNQVIVDYGNEVKKFQEPIKQSQMDIMTQRSNDKHELKDLFTIDELIKESKRKDDEREKESKKINKDAEDLTEIKESIKMRKENKDFQDELIEEVVEEEDSKEESIADIINEDEEKADEDVKTEIGSASQKDVEEAIESAGEETEEEEDSEESITDALLEEESSEESITEALPEDEEEIKTPALKTPTKIDEKDSVSILSGEDKDYKFGGELEDSELFNDDENDLDYRKDIAKVTNKLKQSKLLQDVKGKFTQDGGSDYQDDFLNESYIRNVNEYEEYEPIINETHVDIDGDYDDYHENDLDQLLREQNTKKIFKSQPAPEVKKEESEIAPIKSKPSRDNIKIQLNGSETVLNKGDEIIFKHDGDTYSSKVFAINGDDISVRYRRKNITIKPEDVKKIY